MEILLSVYKGENSPDMKVKTQLSEIRLIPLNRDLVLVRQDKMGVKQKGNSNEFDFFEIYPILFLAFAKSDKYGILMFAQYIDEGKEPNVYILDGLPPGYFNDGPRLYLIDYLGYKNICELTGETVLKFGEYCQHCISEKHGISVNALLYYKESFLNSDQQRTLYSTEDPPD